MMTRQPTNQPNDLRIILCDTLRPYTPLTHTIQELLRRT